MSHERAEPVGVGYRVGGRFGCPGVGGPVVTSVDAGVLSELNRAVDEAFTDLPCFNDKCDRTARWICYRSCGCRADLVCNPHRTLLVLWAEGSALTCHRCSNTDVHLTWEPIIR